MRMKQHELKANGEKNKTSQSQTVMDFAADPKRVQIDVPKSTHAEDNRLYT